MKKPKLKLFIVRKYIMAKSAPDTIHKDKVTPPDDVWIDDDWKKGNEDRLERAIGFLADNDEPIYELAKKKCK